MNITPDTIPNAAASALGKLKRGVKESPSTAKSLSNRINGAKGGRPAKRYVLRRKSDGWFVSAGQNHHSVPASAVHLTLAESRKWIAAWGNKYEVIPLSEASEVN